jgi:hypothetical protein
MIIEAAAAMAEAKKAELRAEIQKLESDLRRLRSAQKVMKPAKEDVRDLKDSVRKQKKPDSPWKGQHRNIYGGEIEGFISDYTLYYNRVSSILSSINSKIFWMEAQLNIKKLELAALSLV